MFSDLFIKANKDKKLIGSPDFFETIPALFLSRGERDFIYYFTTLLTWKNAEFETEKSKYGMENLKIDLKKSEVGLKISENGKFRIWLA